MRTIASLFLAVPILLGACAVDSTDPVDDEPNEVASTEQTLNNAWTPVGCTAAEQQKISGAFAIIASRIDDPAYLECVKGAYLVERYGVIPEDIIATLQELPTTVQCVPAGTCGGSAAACATVPAFGDDIPETMSIERDYLAATTATSLAGTITHEAAHTHGWNHAPNGSDLAYRGAVPNQFASCMANLDPTGWSRNDPYGDAELAVAGGEGGQPFHLRCPAGEHATGVTVDASTIVNRIQLRCSDGSVTARAGEFKDSTSTITDACAPGGSLIGFTGRSDTMVRRLSSHCALDVELEADIPDPSTEVTFVGGGTAGTPWDRMCPIGMAVVGAVGRSGARIDQVRWLCADLDGEVLPNPHTWGYRGTRTGNSKLELCSGRGAIRALWGHAGGEVDQLGAECYPTVTDATTGAPSAVAGTTNRQELDFNGGTGGPVFNKPCPSGMLMVGLRFRSGARIDAIGGLCADASLWGGGSSTATTNVSLSGGTTGAYSTLLCPAREFVVGVQTWAAFTPEQGTTTIHAVQPLCRRLDVP